MTSSGVLTLWTCGIFYTLFSSFPVTAQEEQALRVLSVEPSPEATLMDMPGAFRFHFNQIPNGVLISPQTLQVLGSGGDGAFDGVNDFIIPILSVDSPASLELAFFRSVSAFQSDLYQLTLGGTPDQKWTDDELILSLEETRTLLPDPYTLQRVRVGLSRNRTADPRMTGIHANPNWILGEIVVQLTPEAYLQFQNGTYTGLDQLNAHYGPVEIDALGPFGPNFIELDFEKPYYPPVLAGIYSSEEGVVFAEHRRFLGDPGEELEMLFEELFSFRIGDGDCPSGCLFSHIWVFGESGNLIAEWGDDLSTPEFGGRPHIDLPDHVSRSWDGEPLDGEFSGTFPSGDGIEGGDFILTFSVDLTLGDIDLTGTRDVADLVLLVNHLSSLAPLPEGEPGRRADIDLDHQITFHDLDLLLDHLLNADR